MRRTVFWLTTELDNCGTETHVFGTEAEVWGKLAEIMREDLEDEWSQAKRHENAGACIALLDHGQNYEALLIYNDNSNPIQNEDSAIWWGQQEVTFPDIETPPPADPPFPTRAEIDQLKADYATTQAEAADLERQLSRALAK